MDLMKLYPFAFAAFSALVVGALPQPAQALPFAKNCASMQSWFNSKNWTPKTKFSGFENRQMSNVGPMGEAGMYTCDLGYYIEESPMGTKVCDRVLIYYAKNGSPGWENFTTPGGTCRYK
jgi:hypothetical protein